MSEHVRIPLSTEARAQLRRFKVEVKEREAKVEALLNKNSIVDDALDHFMYKSGKGQERALNKLKQTLPAKLEFVRNKPRCIVWSLPVCSDHLITEPSTKGETQPAVVIEFILAHFEEHKRSFTVQRGIWTLELPDHAIGRMFQRNPKVDPFAAVHETHRALLASMDTPVDRNEAVYIPTMQGVFAGNIIWGGLKIRDVHCDPQMAEFIQQHFNEDYNQILVYFRAKTWLHNDQLAPTQVPLPKATPTFGQGLMLPYPLRTLQTHPEGKRLFNIVPKIGEK